ncbi:MAG: nickel pincer cofactor biosynthesis protein LarB, partial [Candidatus Altiarchaeales archaeon]|nr:nickel pincer cofactor biosynthesis protein LarB [Candidatus Altiarchaeales archaeon]
PEIVLGSGKTAEDLRETVRIFLADSGRVMVTRIDGDVARDILSHIDGRKFTTCHSEKGRVLVIRRKNYRIKKIGTVGIITAGTSDIAVAEEARVLAEELGCEVLREYDVGIAGIHRLFPAIEGMKKASALIVIAGMEGALPSVVSGLVDVPVIGVPSSVGYGVGAGGKTALFTMLNSCTPLAVVNIDNGCGAAVLAHQILRTGSRGGSK